MGRKEQQVVLTVDPSPLPVIHEILMLQIHFVCILYARLYCIIKKVEALLAKDYFWLTWKGGSKLSSIENEHISQDRKGHRGPERVSEGPVRLTVGPRKWV